MVQLFLVQTLYWCFFSGQLKIPLMDSPCLLVAKTYPPDSIETAKWSKYSLVAQGLIDFNSGVGAFCGPKKQLFTLIYGALQMAKNNWVTWVISPL